jgi:hypothetical protein
MTGTTSRAYYEWTAQRLTACSASMWQDPMSWANRHEPRASGRACMRVSRAPPADRDPELGGQRFGIAVVRRRAERTAR